MKATNVNSIIDTPLAGCDDIILSSGNYSTLKDSLFMRLRLAHKLDVSMIIIGEIEKESLQMITVRKQYVINEMQYEMRICSRFLHPEYTVEFESQLLDNWAAALAKDFALDDVLDFVFRLKEFRKQRKRY